MYLDGKNEKYYLTSENKCLVNMNNYTKRGEFINLKGLDLINLLIKMKLKLTKNQIILFLIKVILKLLEIKIVKIQ